MKSTAAEVEAALANYRKVSAERNKRLLAVYIDAITKAEFTDKKTREDFSDEEWQEWQMLALAELLGSDMESLEVFAPSDLLDHYDEIVGLIGLDGTTCGNLRPEDRAKRAASYFDALDAALKEKAPEEVKQIISAPGEFRVIAVHVLEIVGSVLPDDTIKHAMSFWKDEGIWDHSKIPARIIRPENLEYPWSVDEKIAIQWDPGMVLEGEFSCLYIQEPDGTWDWKFGWRWQGDQRIFNTIPELVIRVVSFDSGVRPPGS
ncbi:hypothetical protein LA080_003197 [Diaporthe eres]|uniref:Uncharacterized protein n=1 Tax=Diaporthe vaccinii TaxID=105482 RepID=A0ABR4F9Y1_9PEZI|nr:hypothetical protein LA080_003197 [Diaporthe eres]